MFKYKPGYGQNELDENLCEASVAHGDIMGSHQCQRKHKYVVDGMKLCLIHAREAGLVEEDKDLGYVFFKGSFRTSPITVAKIVRETKKTYVIDENTGIEGADTSYMDKIRKDKVILKVDTKDEAVKIMAEYRELYDDYNQNIEALNEKQRIRINKLFKVKECL